MASLIDVSAALENDFPTLAHIAALAMSVDLVQRVIYDGNDPFDTSRQERSVMAELGRAAKNTQAHIYKATLKSSGQIVGYAMFRFEDTALPAAVPSLTTNFITCTNAKLLERILGEVRAAHKKHMADKRHICQAVDVHTLLYVSFAVFSS